MIKQFKLAAGNSDAENNDSYNSHSETTNSENKNLSTDELISTLQNQRENRRARQVFEWENTRRNNTLNFS